jgi:hypothetical protein
VQSTLGCVIIVEGFGGKEGCNGGIVEMTFSGFGFCVQARLEGFELVRLGALVMDESVFAERERGGAGVECGIGPADEPDPSASFRSRAAECGVRRCPSAEDVSVAVWRGVTSAMSIEGTDELCPFFRSGLGWGDWGADWEVAAGSVLELNLIGESDDSSSGGLAGRFDVVDSAVFEEKLSPAS